MKLAVFDLDHTLLPIDSGDAWSHWLVEKAGLDREILDERIEGYAESYRQGNFVPLDFFTFSFRSLRQRREAILMPGERNSSTGLFVRRFARKRLRFSWSAAVRATNCFWRQARTAL